MVVNIECKYRHNKKKGHQKKCNMHRPRTNNPSPLWNVSFFSRLSLFNRTSPIVLNPIKGRSQDETTNDLPKLIA